MADARVRLEQVEGRDGRAAVHSAHSRCADVSLAGTLGQRTVLRVAGCGQYPSHEALAAGCTEERISSIGGYGDGGVRYVEALTTLGYEADPFEEAEVAAARRSAGGTGGRGRRASADRRMGTARRTSLRRRGRLSRRPLAGRGPGLPRTS